MPRTGVTQEQVFEAAQRLAAKGEVVTVQTVRETLGFGSFTTITPHLREWRSQGKQPSALPVTVPAEVEAAGGKAIAAIWQAAEELARREIEAIRHGAQRQVAEARFETEEMFAEVSRLEQQADAANRQITDQAEKIEALRDALARSQAQLALQASSEREFIARLNEAKMEIDQLRETSQQKVEECALLRGELLAVKSDRAASSKAPSFNTNVIGQDRI